MRDVIFSENLADLYEVVVPVIVSDSVTHKSGESTIQNHVKFVGRVVSVDYHGLVELFFKDVYFFGGKKFGGKKKMKNESGQAGPAWPRELESLSGLLQASSGCEEEEELAGRASLGVEDILKGAVKIGCPLMSQKEPVKETPQEVPSAQEALLADGLDMKGKFDMRGLKTDRDRQAGMFA